MKVYENQLYRDDVEYISNLNLPWEKLQDKSIVISGATGLIGSMFIDVIMRKNLSGLGCTIYALGRSRNRMKQRFGYCCDNPLFKYLEYDAKRAIDSRNIDTADYVLHLASNTHPVSYSTDPIGTIETNIIGVRNLIQFSIEHEVKRFAFASSNEIYGENRGDVEKFDERYCGYIDCNTMRAGYPESKRCGEALCQAYIAQENMDIVIPRLTRSYGPTLLSSDTKALSQFLHKAIAGENIILKSLGNQYYSYLYVMDSVSGLLTVLLKGKNGEAYNISDEMSDIKLKDLAEIIANYVGREVIYEIPDAVESAGYSKATKARLDSEKLQKLGWSAKYDIKTGVERTLDIMKNIG